MGDTAIPAFTEDFKQVLKREYAELWLRRPKDMREKAGAVAETGEMAPPALYGVALSGGGIRSASFCLGALQALDQQGMAERIDYLSTVSGGGYTGASMISAMRQNGERFPFSPGKASDMSDNEPVNNLRDNSRFLAPRGFADLLISLAVILRGLVVNLILILAFVLPLATILVLANPTKEDLSESIVDDVARYWVPEPYKELPLYKQVLPYLADPFLMTKTFALLLFLWLLGWALLRSFVEFRGLPQDKRVPEQHSKGAKWGRLLIIWLAAALFLELQPPILLWAMNALEARTGGLPDASRGSVAGTIATLAAAVVALTATFQTTFMGWIQKALNSPTFGAKLKAFVARSMIYSAGLILPLMIYLFFLLITIWGIRPGACTNASIDVTGQERACASVDAPYPFTPDILAVASRPVLVALVLLLGAAVIAAVVVRSLARGPHNAREVVAPLVKTALWVAGMALATVVIYFLRSSFGGGSTVDAHSFLGIALLCVVIVLLCRLVVFGVLPTDGGQGWSDRLKAFVFEGWRWSLTVFVVLFFMGLSASATRPVDFSSTEWTVLLRYAACMLLIWVVGWQFTENANGLHRLYRDRISAAFRLGKPENLPLRLSELDDSSPYLLVNATLNAREGDRGRDKNPASDPEAERKTDPAKRGRNAEFFLFSRLFVGSTSTGYAATSSMEAVDAQLDLATAVAISGAAVSSSMGRIRIGLLGPTLALLNLRLGYWLANPRQFDPANASGGTGQARRMSWHERLRLYLFAEAFGKLNARSPRVYVTDGGHIDNIGLYQLLKRRCKFIVVIDGEADPSMTFGAFSDLQRFARIDEGVRVTLEWLPIRDAALARMADRTKRAAPGEAAHDHHFAIGKIYYGAETGGGAGGESDEGLLIYVKASVTGDEPDYVLDYERRYPLFPHESTGDQFFSEEQMEAYRALGYHCVARFLAADRTGTTGLYERGKTSPVSGMLHELEATASTFKLGQARPFSQT